MVNPALHGSYAFHEWTPHFRSCVLTYSTCLKGRWCRSGILLNIRTALCFSQQPIKCPIQCGYLILDESYNSICDRVTQSIIDNFFWKKFFLPSLIQFSVYMIFICVFSAFIFLWYSPFSSSIVASIRLTSAVFEKVLR